MKSPHHSLVLSIARGINPTSKTSEKFNKPLSKPERSRHGAKGESVSNSMSRMIRSSPKIHLKQHISSQGAINSVNKKTANANKPYHNKLHLNRISLEKGILNQESSRNQKLEAINQRQLLNPIRHSEGSVNRSKPFFIHDSWVARKECGCNAVN